MTKSEADPAAEKEFVQKTKDLGRDAKRVADDIQGLYATASEQVDLGKIYQENPWMVLGLAAAAGYFLGGGLFTPLTGRLVKIGARVLVLPIVSSQIVKAMPSTEDE